MTTTLVDPAELVSFRDIARRFKVTHSAPAMWAQRYDDFPEPVATTAAGRLWLWPAVQAWHAAKWGGR